MLFYITKASGEKELFDIEKFKKSLKRTGACDEIITQLVKEIKDIPELKTTRQIYDFAIHRLQKKSPHLAARYNLKQAIMELGPAGFPFEQFIAALFTKLGYKTAVGTIAHGACVTHEIDVAATKEDERLMIECKFHNLQGIKVDVQVSLYIKARFDDLNKKNSDSPLQPAPFNQALIATNTKFTTQAIQYAECVGLKLLGWSYPTNHNLPALIEKLQLHPITALTSLSRSQKRACIKNGLILCNNAQNHAETLKKLRFSNHDIQNIIRESSLICDPFKKEEEFNQS